MRGFRLVVQLLLALVLVALCAACNVAPNPYNANDGGSATGEGGGSTTTGEGGAGGLIPPTGGSGGEDACPVDCIPSADAPFDEVSMFAIGTPDEVPDCPEWAPEEGMVAYADPQPDPYTCTECTCSPAGCAFPETIHASAAPCSQAESASLSFDPPSGWEGTCSAEGPVPAGLQCAGEPCVQSITIAAPTVTPCEPGESTPVNKHPIAWGKKVRQCRVNVDEDGGGCPHGGWCAPTPAEGFQLCLFLHTDDPAYLCPSDYAERHLVNVGPPEDHRGCEPCSCGDPDGACSALVSIHTNAACGALLGSFPVSSTTEEGCFDLPPGSPLSSKSAVWAVDAPGTCTASGGTPSGAIEPTGPVTLCCRPALPPAE